MVGSGFTAAGDGDGGGDQTCDVDEDEYIAVRDEYADPEQFATAVESLDGIGEDLQAFGVEGGEFLQASARVATKDCEPVPEYRALWKADGGGGVAMTIRPESGTYRAAYRPDIERGGGDHRDDHIPCYFITTEDYTGCTPDSFCCQCEEVILEVDDPNFEYRFCHIVCEPDCDACPFLCGIYTPPPVDIDIPENVGICC